MERRALVGMVVMAAAVVGVGFVAGCQSEVHKDNPYISEQGRPEAITDTPAELQDFARASYPDAEVENVYEMRHRQDYAVRHFEIHLILPGGRKKVVEYNTFVKPTQNARQLQKYEVQGSGTSPAAQPRGESEGVGK